MTAVWVSRVPTSENAAEIVTTSIPINAWLLSGELLVSLLRTGAALVTVTLVLDELDPVSSSVTLSPIV